MRGDLLELVRESKALNSKIFSLPRLLILFSLDQLPEGELATYRELKAALQLQDGVLFGNLKVLVKMGYIREEKVKLKGEKMQGYGITGEGREALQHARAWLARWMVRTNGQTR